jgi:hypothetical protein
MVVVSICGSNASCAYGKGASVNDIFIDLRFEINVECEFTTVLWITDEEKGFVSEIEKRGSE